jgi:hypothetical protein
MATYRPKWEIEAERWTGKNPTVMRNFTGDHYPLRGRPHPVFIMNDVKGHAMLYIERRNQWVVLSLGDYIVKESVGFDRYRTTDFRYLFEKV